MTEKKIQEYLFTNSGRRYSVMVPNYTPSHWFECDLFAVSRAGLFHEYEIKVTVSDFKADRQKRRPRTWRRENGQRIEIPGETKHALLTARSTDGPSRFYYIVPEGLIELKDVPEFAGLQYFCQARNYYGLRIIRRAPTLHSNGVDDKIVRHALSVCYYRFWHERRKTGRLLQEFAADRQEQLAMELDKIPLEGAAD